MGAPAVTWFCRNGHIVLDVPHHYIADDPEQCQYCGSTELACQMEWGDEDYGPHAVPTEPIRHEEAVVQIPVYDVSSLFNRQSR